MCEDIFGCHTGRRDVTDIQRIPIDWFDLLAVQGTLKTLLQHQSSKALILRHSAFFTVQLSHPYMTTGKTIALQIAVKRREVKSKGEKER